jgi:hypothetical protein
MPTYVHELPDWPKFHWDQGGLAKLLAAVRHRQGRLIGRMQALGFPSRQEAVLKTLTEDVLKSSTGTKSGPRSRGGSASRRAPCPPPTVTSRAWSR